MTCATCANEGNTERHHIAGRKNCDAAIVPLCPPCHREQTDMQWRRGVLSRRNRAPSDMLLLHALVEGLAGILTANAHNAGNSDLAQSDQRCRHATAQLLGLISDDQLGPRPTSNDRNSKRRSAGQPARPKPPNVSPAKSVKALAGIFPALACAVFELLGDDDCVEVAQRIAAGAEQLADGLVALEDHPRSAELTIAAEHGMRLGLAAIEQLAIAAAAGGFDDHGKLESEERIIERIREFQADARTQLSFAFALADSGPAGAHVAFDRFLEERAAL